MHRFPNNWLESDKVQRISFRGKHNRTKCIVLFVLFRVPGLDVDKIHKILKDNGSDMSVYAVYCAITRLIRWNYIKIVAPTVQTRRYRVTEKGWRLLWLSDSRDYLSGWLESEGFKPGTDGSHKVRV